MSDLLFHPQFAWNLLDDLQQSRVVPESINQGYPGKQIAVGKASGWVNDRFRAYARQMLVFADSVILPHELDVPQAAQSIERTNCIDFAWERDEGQMPPRLGIEYQNKASNELAVSLIHAIDHADTSIDEVKEIFGWFSELRCFKASAIKQMGDDPKQFEMVEMSNLRHDLINGSEEQNSLWDRLKSQQREQLRRLFTSDPEKKRKTLGPRSEKLQRAANFWLAAEKFREAGIPALAQASVAKVSNEANRAPDSAGLLVRLYFDQVPFPAPQSAADALNLRGNDRIDRWRHQIKKWQGSLLSSDASLEDIRKELREASSYIEGARGFATATGKIPLWLTVPPALAAVFCAQVGVEPGALQPLADLTTIVGGVQLYGWIVSKAVHSSDPLKYGWVLVEPMN